MKRLIFLLLSVLLITGNLNAQNITPIISVVDNNVSGGGFQSDVTITDDGQTIYSSADVSGIFKSTNGGLSYKNINEGLKSPKVASLAITPDNPQILYAGTGDKGGSGGLFRSVNGGDSWRLTDAGDNAQFSGNHSDTKDANAIPTGHPRSNGDLIVVDVGSDTTTFTDDIVIAGTYKSGVKLFSAGGNVLEETIMDNGFVRSLAYNSAVPNTVYAAIQFSDSSQNGIYKINYSNDFTTVTYSLEYATLRPEGITVLASSRVYAAIGESGIVKYNGTNWSLKNSGLSINNSNRKWTAVTGYLKFNNNSENDVVYAGLNNEGGSQNGEHYSSIWRTVNGGNTWTPLVIVDSNVSDQIYGQSYDWWFRTNAFREAGLGRRNSIVSSIEVALGPFPSVVSDDIIYVSGRGGIWKSADGGDNWNPAVYNMQATSNEGVAVNPKNPSQIALANTDYVVLATSNGFEDSDIYRDKPSGAESRAYDIIFDATTDEVIIGVGKRDNNNSGGGEVYVKSTNALGNTATSWNNTGLIDKTSDNNGRVRAITYGYHDGDSNTSQIILAAVEGEGVFRYHNENWKKSNIWFEGNKINIDATHRSNFVWPDNANSGVVYLLDLSIGLYRSKDGGENWVNIWPDMSFNNKNFYNTGYITADNNDPTIIYLSIQGGCSSAKLKCSDDCYCPAIGTDFKVYRMTGANKGVFAQPQSAPDPVTGEVADDITDITTFHFGDTLIERPGPIVFGPDGRLWLTQQQDSPNGYTAGLFVMENPTTDLSFTNVTTNEYRSIAIKPSGIDVSTDSHIYISQNGTGLVKIRYSDKPNMALSASLIEINPNTTSNLYTISGNLALYNIAILDANGAVHSSISNNETSVSIDLSDLPEGIFFIRISDPNTEQMYVEKILKF